MSLRSKSAKSKPLCAIVRSFCLWCLAGALVACASDEVPPPCPRVVVVKDAARQIRFVGEGRDLTDVVFEARLDAAGVECDYDDNIIEVDMMVRLEAVRGPAAQSESAELKYFVAVARSDLTILVREEFKSTIPLPGNQTRTQVIEEISPEIPIDFEESGKDFNIYVGLAVTEEELRYNKANR